MTTNNNIHISLNSANTMCKHLGFITAVPSDIVTEIFGHLSQQDCLTCMAVCRDWYSIVPQYAEALWKEIRLSEWDASNIHQRREQCLGRHVKSVTVEPTERSRRIKEETLYATMIKLFEWGCTEVTSFEFISCYVSDQKEFIRSLKELAPRITHLCLSKCSSKFDISYFLIAFPELTHFTCHNAFSFGLMTGESSAAVQHAAMPIDFQTKLKILWLDTDNLEEKQDLLKRSPDLRCFIDDHDDISTYLDSLVSWCPKLVCIEANSYNRFERQREDYSTYVKKSPNGLRYISLYNRSDQVARQLVKSQGTLEYLSIFNDRHNYDWTRTPGLARFSNLRVLTIIHNKFTAQSLVAMLNCCPILEKLKLHPRHDVLELNPAALMLLRKMQMLRCLDCNSITLSRDLSLLTFLEWFPALETLVIPRLHLSPKAPPNFDFPRQLKHVELSEVVWVYGDDSCDNRAEVAHFFECLLGHSSLETVRLCDVPAAPRLLLMLTTIPTLKGLEVQLDHTVEEKHLLQFAKELGEATSIEQLTVRYIPNISFAMFEALAKIPTLTHFTIEPALMAWQSFTHVSKDGLLHILRRSSTLVSIAFNGDVNIIDEQGQRLEALQVSELVKQQIPHNNIPSAGSKYWNMCGFLFNDQKDLRNVSIQLVDRTIIAY